MKTLATAIVLGVLASAAGAQEAPKPEAPKAPAAPAAQKPDLVPWLKDYAAAKERAAKEKKGLLVYLTPAWFT